MSIGVELRIGRELLGYRIERVLGRGGMGVVYLAHQFTLDRMVALKLLAPELASDETFRERFLRESKLAASLDHPNIVPVHDAGEVEGQLYIAMRYVEGSDLRRLLGAAGPLSPTRAIALLAPVADALDTAHGKGLVHRDVKPSNILVDERERPYLADFGLTRRLADQGVPAPHGLSLGTPAYVAPEQIAGEAVDSRADQYSLACLLYECLVGRAPFARDSELAVLWAHLQEEPPAAASYPALGPVLGKALAKEPGARYGSCRELVEAAREALGIAEPARSRWLRVPVVLGLAGLALIAAALAGYFALSGGDRPPAVSRDSLVRIDPAANDVVDSIPVGPRASSVTFGDGYLWVTSQEDRTLWRIDPTTGRTRATKVAGGPPTDVAVRDGLAVITYGPAPVGLELIDAASGASEWTFQLPGAGGAPAPVAAGADDIWLAASGFEGENVGRVTRAPAVSGAAGALERVAIREDPTFLFFYTPDSGSYNDVAVGAGRVWLARDGGPLLKLIDPKAERVVATIELPFRSKSLSFGAGALWVTGLFDDVVARLDPKTHEVTKSVPLPPGTDGVAVGEGSVWVASSIAGTVTRIDPQTGEILATIDVGARPEDVAVGAGAVWVTRHTP